MTDWGESIRDVTGAFQGFTAPSRELYDEIHKRGWTTNKVQIKDHSYAATAKNPHGESVEATGPNEQTALGNLLIKIVRREHIRTTAMRRKLGMWDTTFDDQLQEIAQAYAEAPVYDPKAAAAWIELARDSQQRADVLRGQLQAEIVDEPQPYKTADEMREDVKEKQHIFISRASATHPVWTVEQVVAFRLVHDVLGHCVGGGDWGWHGENQAFAAHAPLLSESAQNALFAETLGQSAYGAVYRALGPQKIVFLEDQIEKIQEQENKPGHTPVHPSQSLAPAAIPQFENETALPQEGRRSGSSTVSSPAAATLADPNAEWKSNIEPLPDNAFLWQREPTTGTDPLDIDGVTENAHTLDPQLGQMPIPLAKQAVVNAFRAALLAPRKNRMGNALHYQHVMGIPADVDDPMVYWDTLERQRSNQNSSRGFPSAPIPFDVELQQFQRWVRSHNPRLDDRDAHALARRELLHMLQEEEERIVADDPGEQLPAEQVEAMAYENLQRRLKTLTKPRVDEKHDFGDSTLWKQAHAGPYNSFLASHLRPIAGVSHHADKLTDAALTDFAHRGTGHQFRSQALDLGIPGITPKIASLAWLHLHPQGSQLAVLDPHLMEALGHKYDTDMNDRDYFKFERELAAGRDAAGYGHVPLGSFGWGLRDYKTGGPGFHQDQTALRALNPTPHDQVDWIASTPPEPAWQNPYWWASSQEARDQVGNAWDEHIAVNHPKSSIPFQRFGGLNDPAPWFSHEESGREDTGAPGESLMQFLKMNFGLDSVHDVWGLQGLQTRKVR